MTPRTVFPCLLLALLAGAAHADVVDLANGDRISGVVRSVDGTSVVVQTDYAGTVVLDREAVAAVQTDEPVNVKLDGETIAGVRLVRAASGEQGVATAAGVREIGFGNLRAASVSAPVEVVEDRWDAKVTYGFNGTSGNSETTTHALRGSVTLRRDDLRHRAKAGLDRKVDDENVTKDEQRLGYQLDWFFRDDWYAYGTGEYFKDDIKDVTYRYTLGAGAGHQFWDDSLGALSAEGGVTAVIEEIGGVEEENPAARVAVDYTRKLFGQRVEFFHNDELLVLADFDRGQILDSSTGLRLKLYEGFTADVRLDVLHETEPAEGQENTDLTYILGFGYTF